MLQGPTRASRCGRTISALVVALVACGPACRSASELFPGTGTADAGPRGEPATVDTTFQPPAGEALGLRSLSGLVRLPDDRLLLAGTNWVRDRAALVRLLPDGARDVSYGDGGMALSPCLVTPGHAWASGPALLSDGTAALVTFESSSVGLRLLLASPDGRDVRCLPCSDLIVGGQSLVRADLIGNLGLAATTDDGVLILGTGPTGTGPLLFRLSAGCTLAPGFGSGGVLAFSEAGSMLESVLQLADGTIYVAGRHGFYEGGLYAFDATGRPLATGIDGGRVPLAAGLGSVGTVVPAGANRLLAAATSGANQLTLFAVAGPALDPAFAPARVDATATGGLALEANGDVLLTASSDASPCHLVRFHADGGRDPSFPPGLRPQPFTRPCDAIATQSDGRVVLAGPVFQPLVQPPDPPQLVRIWP